MAWIAGNPGSSPTLLVTTVVRREDRALPNGCGRLAGEEVEDPPGLVPVLAKKVPGVDPVPGRPLIEEFARLEVAIHVHFNLRRDLDGLREEEADGRHLCVALRWPEGLPGVRDLRKKVVSRCRRVSRADPRAGAAARGCGWGDRTVLVPVPQFLEYQERGTRGFLPAALPCMARLQPLEDCVRGTVHEERAPVGSLASLLGAIAAREAGGAPGLIVPFPLAGGPRWRGAGVDEVQLGRLLEHFRVVLLGLDGVRIAISRRLQGALESTEVVVRPTARPRCRRAGVPFECLVNPGGSSADRSNLDFESQVTPAMIDGENGDARLLAESQACPISE